MKRFYIILLMLFILFPCLNIKAENLETKNENISVSQNNNDYDFSKYKTNSLLSGSFLTYSDYFYYNADNDAFEFIEMNKSLYKSLSKNQKQFYKKMKKVNKYIAKQKYNQAYNIDPTCIAISYTAYKNKKQKNNFSEALTYWKKVIELDKYTNYFNTEYLQITLAYLYNLTDQYDLYLATIKPYLKNKICQTPYDYYLLAGAYYKIKDYDNSIFYAKKIENNQEYKKFAYECLYLNYYNKRNMTVARNYALKLASIAPNSINYYRIINTTTSKSEQLKYYYLIADEYMHSNNKEQQFYALSIMYNNIIPLENEKIKSSTKSLKGFVEIPDYKLIFDNDYKYMNAEQAYNRCKNLYKELNDGIKKYYGHDLKACFNSINNKQRLLSDRLIQEQRAYEQRYAEQQRLLEMRQMNANMQYSNYLQRQQNYQLSRPRYTNTTITPVGNSYYMNSYSY